MAMYPQDGNVFAIKFNLTTSQAQAAGISQGITTNWNEFGSVSPEAQGTISPYITSSEIEAHFSAQPANASRAMEILRRQWGYMLHAFSNSTLIEGFYETGVHDYPFYGDGNGAYLSHAHSWSAGRLLLGRVDGRRRPKAFFQASFTVPSGTTGSIAVPTFGVLPASLEISINGATVWRRGESTSDVFGVAAVSDGHVVFPVATEQTYFRVQVANV